MTNKIEPGENLIIHKPIIKKHVESGTRDGFKQDTRQPWRPVS
jgi:hypothetical protein